MSAASANACPLAVNARVLAALVLLVSHRKSNWLGLVEVPVVAGGRGREAVLCCADRWLRLAGRPGAGASCFARSVLLCRVLRQSGVPASITFGAARGERGEDGGREKVRHCWVEAAGEGPPEGWKPVFRYPE